MANRAFFKIENSLVETGKIADVGAHAICVYLVLAKCAGADGICFPSYSKIMVLTGFGRATVAASLKRLISIGLIAKSRPGNCAKKLSNEYVLTSSAAELVQDVNQQQLVQQLNRTSSVAEPALVQQLNSKKTHKKKTHRKDKARLLEIVAWWNDLAPTIGRSTAKTDPIAKSVQTAFAKVEKSAELKSYFADLAVLATGIRESTFLHGPGKGWFTLTKLLGGKNKSGEYIVEVINNGGYRVDNSRKSTTRRSPVRQGAGVVYDPSHSGRF